MSDNFFDFSSLNDSRTMHLEDDGEEDDDIDYDALNNETFGEDVLPTDWEEAHERYSSSMKDSDPQHYEEDIENLSERVASFILDDEGDESFSMPNLELKKGGDPMWSQFRPSQNRRIFTLEEFKNMVALDKNRPESGSVWKYRSSDQPEPQPTVTPAKMPPKPSGILTVEEIEQRMRNEAEKVQSTQTTVSPSPSQENLPKPSIPVNLPDMPRNMQRNQTQMPVQNGQMRRVPMVNQNQNQFEVLHQHPYPPMHMRPQFLRPFPGPGHHNFNGPGPLRPMRMPLDGRRFPGHMMMPPRLRDYPPRPPHFPEPNVHMMYQDRFEMAQQGYNRMHPAMYDEYAGLMSPQEKQWLCSIQMMQLNSSNPLQDDYYFLMYQQRQQGASLRKMGGHNMKNREVTSKPAYTPLQFENSLGKLQIGSVTAPRKIIDMDIVENVESNPKQVDKKSKQILMEIEEMYTIVLLMEDQTSNNSAQPTVHIAAMKEKIVNSLLGQGKLVSIMAIRKGRKVVLRLIPHLSKADALIERLLEDLVPIVKKDSEQLLLSFLPSIRNHLSTVPLESLVKYIKNYDSAFLFSSKLTVSVMADLVGRAAQICGQSEEPHPDLGQWLAEVERLAAAAVERLASGAEALVRPVVAVERGALSRHLALCPALPANHSAALARALGTLTN